MNRTSKTAIALVAAHALTRGGGARYTTAGAAPSPVAGPAPNAVPSAVQF